MRVAVTEGTEYKVRALAAALRARGDEVVHLTRTPSSPDDRGWSPEAAAIEGPGLSDVDAVVNLRGGRPQARFSPALREELRTERITATLTVVSHLDPDGRCQRLLNLSSTSFYGDAGAEEVTADSPRGPGSLAKATADWEVSARHAPVPTALLRTPGVLARDGGYLVERRHLRGRLGTGRQYRPWVHLDDWVAATLVLLDVPKEGPVNMVAPEPVTEAEFVAEWARASGRRPGLPVPDLVLDARFGGAAADELYRASTRARPQVLGELGFTHRFPTLRSALADVVAPASSRA